MDSLGWSWDGRWWRCHGAAAPAEGARSADGAPAREERRGPAGEDQWEVENRFRGLPRVEDGGRRGLHGGLGGGGGHGGQRGFLGAVGARASFWERERVESRGEGALLRSKRGREGAVGRGTGCRWCTALKAGRGQRLGQVRAPWRAALARRLVEPGRGAARRARRRRDDGTRRWRAHHGRPRVGAQPAKRHRRAAAGMPLCSAPW